MLGLTPDVINAGIGYTVVVVFGIIVLAGIKAWTNISMAIEQRKTKRAEQYVSIYEEMITSMKAVLEQLKVNSSQQTESYQKLTKVLDQNFSRLFNGQHKIEALNHNQKENLVRIDTKLK